MFYENGRLYFTRSGTNELRYRYFTPESGVVGGKRLVASVNVTGISFSTVRGMFFADGKLHWSDSAGVLRRIDWREDGPSGVPVAGTATTLSGPAVDGVSWSGRGPVPLPGPAGPWAPRWPRRPRSRPTAPA